MPYAPVDKTLGAIILHEIFKSVNSFDRHYSTHLEEIQYPVPARHGPPLPPPIIPLQTVPSSPLPSRDIALVGVVVASVPMFLARMNPTPINPQSSPWWQSPQMVHSLPVPYFVPSTKNRWPVSSPQSQQIVRVPHSWPVARSVPSLQSVPSSKTGQSPPLVPSVLWWQSPPWWQRQQTGQSPRRVPLSLFVSSPQTLPQQQYAP